jgi:hypothetical protein
MKSEADPITEDEWLLRRVHKDRFRSDKVPVISPSAFEPRIKGREPDEDGISLYREACLSSPEDALAAVAEGKRDSFGIVRLPVRALRNLDLTIESKPDDRILGHVVIPELRASAFAASKQSFTPILLDLARIASEEENVVRDPRAP